MADEVADAIETGGSERPSPPLCEVVINGGVNLASTPKPPRRFVRAIGQPESPWDVKRRESPPFDVLFRYEGHIGEDLDEGPERILRHVARPLCGLEVEAALEVTA